METLEDRYLEKIRLNIDEGLYELLVVHIKESHDKIKTKKKEFIELLEKAIENLRKRVNYGNKIFFYRYILLLANRILKYDITRVDLKDLKKELIEDFKQTEEHNDEEIIPLNYQINELRLTYDISYIKYLVKNTFIKKKMWDKALRGVIAAKLVEPDSLELDDLYEEIKSNIPHKRIDVESFGTPENKVLALDSNVVINHLTKDVNGFYSNDIFDLEKLGNKNKFVITPSVFDEVEEHVKFMLDKRRKQIEKYKDFKFNDMKEKIYSKLDKLKEKYGVEVKVDEDSLTGIKELYSNYLIELEWIMKGKLMGKSLSHKLRKLAQREGMAPEDGDLRLLAEVIALNENRGMGLLSQDKDFTNFVGPIKKAFSVEIYGV
jgi:hypothetical protein